MPKVSVVIPTHNRPELLKRALESVYAQTFQDFEVIVVDDGDSPRAESVLEKYTNKQNFFYLETDKNRGGAVTRNIGATSAEGELLAFLDDDDEWVPNKLATQVASFADASDDMLLVFNGVKAVNASGHELYQRLPHHNGEYHPLEKNMTKCFIWTSSVMVKRDIFLQIGGFDESLPKNQEWDLELRLLQMGNFYAINDALTIIHIGESEQMGGAKNLPNIIKGTQLFLSKHEDLYKRYPKAYAKRLFYMGCLYAQNQQYKSARTFWAKALSFEPFFVIALKHWLISFVPFMYRYFHRNVI